VKKLSVLLLVLTALAGCSSSYYSNAEEEYLRSRNGEKLVVPPPLTNANISYFYNLPPQTQDARVSIAPPVKGEIS
jgi:uncharacterized lipoprotein